MHLFYQPNLHNLCLENEEAQHCAKVLRLPLGSSIHITDGKGTVQDAVISRLSSSRVDYSILDQWNSTPSECQINLAVCPTRKAERNEWMVEKMTELGVQKIQFVVSEHTHKETIQRVVNLKRLHRIALSAMKQSLQYFLPEISIFQTFGAYLAQVYEEERYIAYVADSNIPPHLLKKVTGIGEVSILIGPEGDFSTGEIMMAQKYGFDPVSLGSTRLRTETAAVIACHSVHLSRLCKY